MLRKYIEKRLKEINTFINNLKSEFGLLRRKANAKGYTKELRNKMNSLDNIYINSWKERLILNKLMIVLDNNLQLL